MKYDFNCPKCDSSIIKSYDNEVKFRSKLVLWNDKGMFAVCKSCNHEVEIDPDILRTIKSSFSYVVDSDKKT